MAWVVGLALFGATGCMSPESRTSVRPGINDRFYGSESIDPWLGRFETESREIWARREEIVAAVGLHRGAAVADVGAGTGFLARRFAEEVGILGRVYAVELMPYFVTHLARSGRESGLRNFEAVQCTETSVGLPAHAVDVVFLCDTYHHFEYPDQSLASIWKALRPGGQLVVIDFYKKEGVTRPFIMGHVRANEAEATAEIEAAGFRRVERKPFLGENWFSRFRKVGG